MSTVLFGLATPQLPGTAREGLAPMIIAVLAWLAGLAAVWLLWRPACGAFFKPQGRAVP